MKRLLLIALMLTMALTATFAQKQAQISFEKTTINFGTFSESQVQKGVFTFTNTGDAPLVINQATASCGCTVPKYTKEPIAPGAKGTISVTYNGKGKWEGHFKKSITVRTNGTPEIVRLYVEGDMTVPAATTTKQ